MHRRGRLVAAGVLLAGGAGPAWGHPLSGASAADLVSVWAIDPWTLLWLGILVALYARGVGRLWRRAGRGRGISQREFGFFCGGAAAAAFALLSPLHGLGAVLFSAHMTQHELLILLAAPLIVLGRPMVAFAWAAPRVIAIEVGRLGRIRPLSGIWRAMSNPLGAGAVHAVALWTWHLPVLYDATGESVVVHGAQHASFFGSALLLWWSIVGRSRRGWVPGVAAVVLFVTMIHSNALGALLTFASRPWYPSYESTAPAWGITPLEDQQLGGLLMWVPAGMVYLAATLLLLYRWLGDDGRAEQLPPLRSRAAVVNTANG